MAKTVRRGIAKKLKPAAVSWKEMAFPHLPGSKIAVIRGMAQGRYMPTPTPRKKQRKAKEG